MGETRDKFQHTLWEGTTQTQREEIASQHRTNSTLCGNQLVALKRTVMLKIMYPQLGATAVPSWSK